MSDDDNFTDAPQGGIMDRVKEAKRTRGNKKGSFTKRFNKFKERVEAKVGASILKGYYDALAQALEDLEMAHEDYADLVGDDIIEEEGNYLKEPAKQMLEADVMYSQMKRENSQMLVEREKAKVQEGFEAAKSKVIAGMRAFEGSCEVLSKLSLDKNISFVDID